MYEVSNSQALMTVCGSDMLWCVCVPVRRRDHASCGSNMLWCVCPRVPQTCDHASCGSDMLWCVRVPVFHRHLTMLRAGLTCCGVCVSPCSTDMWPCFVRVWLASFPGRRRNGLATSGSSNCYFCCLKVGSTNQISERSHMTTVKLNCVMHWTVAVTPIPLQ